MNSFIECPQLPPEQVTVLAIAAAEQGAPRWETANNSGLLCLPHGVGGCECENEGHVDVGLLPASERTHSSLDPFSMTSSNPSKGTSSTYQQHMLW